MLEERMGLVDYVLEALWWTATLIGLVSIGVIAVLMYGPVWLARPFLRSESIN